MNTEIQIPITCPNCRKVAAKVRARDATAGRVVPCSCGAKITLTGDGGPKMQQAMDNFASTLKRLSRR
jgi:hypothetical protein